MPPPTVTLSEEKSHFLKSSLFSKALNRVLTPGNNEILSFLNALTTVLISFALVIRTFFMPNPDITKKLTVNANMWYNGKAHRAFSSPATRYGLMISFTWRQLATILRLVSIAALDTPVVPPEYCRMIVSSGFRSISFSLNFLPCFKASLNDTVLTRLWRGTILRTYLTTRSTTVPLTDPNNSSIVVVMMTSILVLAAIFSNSAAKFSKIMMAFTSES